MPKRTAPPDAATIFRDRITGHGEVDPAVLLDNPANYRRHSSAQQKAATGVLEEVGWIQGVIVNETTGVLVDGHLRAEPSRIVAHGCETVTIREADTDGGTEASKSLYRCYPGEYGGSGECDLEWPPRLDESWLR